MCASLAERVSHLYECEQLSTYRIAEILGIDRQRVGRILRRSGIVVKPRGAGRRRQPDPRQELVEDLYVRGRLSSGEISALTGIPSRTVRGWLHGRGVATRSRGRVTREDRLAPAAESVLELYVAGGLSASETGSLLGVPRQAVLRTAHDHGLPVRVGGPRPSAGPAEIELITALYADPLVRRALARHGVAPVPPGGAIWERFPSARRISPVLAAELYVDCGLAARQIELLCGTPAETVRRVLRRLGIVRRNPGGRSPFLRRWRAGLLAEPSADAVVDVLAVAGGQRRGRRRAGRCAVRRAAAGRAGTGSCPAARGGSCRPGRTGG